MGVGSFIRAARRWRPAACWFPRGTATCLPATGVRWQAKKTNSQKLPSHLRSLTNLDARRRRDPGLSQFLRAGERSSPSGPSEKQLAPPTNHASPFPPPPSFPPRRRAGAPRRCRLRPRAGHDPLRQSHHPGLQRTDAWHDDRRSRHHWQRGVLRDRHRLPANHGSTDQFTDGESFSIHLSNPDGTIAAVLPFSFTLSNVSPRAAPSARRRPSRPPRLLCCRTPLTGTCSPPRPKPPGLFQPTRRSL